MIGDPTTLNTSGQHSHHFGPSYSTNNDTAYLQPVIAPLRMKYKSIFECCGGIGHKADACIISEPKFLPSSFKININQFNTFHGEEPTYPPREWKIQPPTYHFKSSNSTPNTIPVVSDIMGRLNHHELENCDVEVHT